MSDNKDKSKIIIDTVKSEDDDFKLGRTSLSNQIRKSVSDYRPNEEQKKKRRYKGSKVSFTSKYNNSSQFGDSLKKDKRRLTDAECKDLSLVDPYISSIINTRVSQVTPLADRAGSKFDKGIRVVDIQRLDKDSFENEQEYEDALKIREAEKEAILSWILNCGTADKDVLDEIYKGADPTFKYSGLKDYFQAQTRNLLTFGRMGRQNFRATDGTIVGFRPVPVETIEPVRPGEDVHLTGVNDQTTFQSVEDVKKYNKINEFDKPIAFVQVIDGFQANFFTDRDLVINNYQVQSFVDLNGYPLSPIEFALFLVYMNQHCLSYLRNQFVKGVLTKSMLVLTSTDPSVNISDEDLVTFKAEMQNYASRTDNSSAIPVLAGPIKVDNVRLNDSMKDMEWPTLSNMIIRALCSAYQISPLEAGFGQLGDSAGLGDVSKDNELIQGEERGLRLISDILLSDISDAVFDNFPQAKERYKIELVGIGNESREGVLQRQLQEQQTTATMNDMLSESDKNRLLSYGGDVPLNSLFHNNVVRYMKMGVFMEHYLGEKGASEKPEYDFIIDPSLNQAYQAEKWKMTAMNAKQTELALAQSEGQLQLMNQQMQQGQHQMEMEKQQADMAQEQQAHEQEMAQLGANQDQQEQEQQEEPQPEMEKSEDQDERGLLEALMSKSESMLKSWNNTQEKIMTEGFDKIEK